MSTELTKVDVPVRKRGGLSRNTMAFPRELRDAIPDVPAYAGRVLELDAMSGESTNTHVFGPRVHLKMVVKETGKLSGEFVVCTDLEVESARALAATLLKLAEQAEQMEATNTLRM